jgi:hypothetical protein
MDQWFLILYWSGPIGIGFFLAGLGVLLWGASKVQTMKNLGKKK